jgi:hypothetical protein
MFATNAHTSKFSNCREWRTFLTAVQAAVPYPKVRDAVKSGQAWFIDGAAKTSNWLLAGLRLQRP